MWLEAHKKSIAKGFHLILLWIRRWRVPLELAAPGVGGLTAVGFGGSGARRGRVIRARGTWACATG
jgi:hypothetical protein